jgi:hypothetical protein
MADNLGYTEGSGKSVATDEVTGTGEHVQVVKLAVSADGSRTALTADNTNGLLVDVSRVQTDVSVTALSSSPLPVVLGDGTNSIAVDTSHADAESNTKNHIDVAAKLAYFNGTSWDRARGDTTNGLLVNVATINPGTAATSLGKAEDAPHTTGDTGVMVLGVRNDTHVGRAGTDGDYVPIALDGHGCVYVRGVTHDEVDIDGPVKVGARAIAHGTNPTAVAADDRTDIFANRHGILFTMSGHPNTITRSVHITDAAGAQTDASMVGTIAAGTKVIVTAISVTVDKSVTAASVAVKVGFGATTIPADSTTGANGVLLDHPGIAPGSGLVLGNGGGILGIGGDGEELRLTCADPVGGNVAITFSYFTIES